MDGGQAPQVAHSEPDGRRRRTLTSRAQIVAAMLDLVSHGAISPGAEQVAARAKVGLRTVFRHFSDMESLYREMTEVMEVRLRAVALRPFESSAWRGRLMEIVARRAEGFELIAPFRQASDAKPPTSPVLQLDHARLVAALRAILLRELPAAVAADTAKVEALDLLFSFEAWSRLRADQSLTPDQAQTVIEHAVRALVGGEDG